MKDGWEPLCNFLEKPIPNMPIPHDNVGTDLEFAGKYLKNTKLFTGMISHLKWNCAKYFMYGIVTCTIAYQIKNGRLKLIRELVRKNFL